MDQRPAPPRKMELGIGPDDERRFCGQPVAFEGLKNGVGTHRAAKENRAIPVELELIRHLDKIVGEARNRKTRRAHQLG